MKHAPADADGNGPPSSSANRDPEAPKRPPKAPDLSLKTELVNKIFNRHVTMGLGSEAALAKAKLSKKRQEDAEMESIRSVRHTKYVYIYWIAESGKYFRNKNFNGSAIKNIGTTSSTGTSRIKDRDSQQQQQHADA